MARQYFLGSGKVYLSARDALGNPLGFSPLGNASEVILNPGRAGERQAKYGAYAINNLALSGEPPSLDLTLDEFQSDNLEKVLYGKATVTAAGTSTNEQIVARLGLLALLSKINITSWSQLTHASGAPVYVNGTDYFVNLAQGSLYIPPTGSAISDGQTVKATYNYGAQQKNSGFTTAQPYYALHIDGYNSAYPGTVAQFAGFTFDAYKVKLMPAESFPLISSDLSQIKLKVDIRYDDVRSDTEADGRFFNLKFAQ